MLSFDIPSVERSVGKVPQVECDDRLGPAFHGRCYDVTIPRIIRH